MSMSGLIAVALFYLYAKNYLLVYICKTDVKQRFFELLQDRRRNKGLKISVPVAPSRSLCKTVTLTIKKILRQ